METLDTKRFGLPPYFRTLGLVVVVLAVVVMVGVKLIYGDLDAEFGTANKLLLKAIMVDLIIIGLVFMAMARDKAENEKLFYLRVSAAIGAFSFGVILVLLRTVIDTVYEDEKSFSAGELLLSMLLFYHFTFFITKRKLDKKNN